MYLHASNREYQDGVDVDLVVGVVKYCVESNERGKWLVHLYIALNEIANI